jgi:DNA-binding SARP family transcriptional activator
MLSVSLLGEQAITDDATGIVRTRSSRAVALIAYLALHAGSPQTRQRIASLFWPESTDVQALTNLRRELHHLRQLLGDEPSLVVTGRDLCWRDTESCRVDVRTFDVARGDAMTAVAAEDTDGVLSHGGRALAAYRGELLPGSYDDWLLEARAELERNCVDLCDVVSVARARTGDLTGAVAAARRRIQLQPLEEVGYRALMQLQVELGDRAGAVSTYHHCASVLERELGVIPDPETRASLHRVLAYDQPANLPLPNPSDAERSGSAGTQLVGRSGELARLGELWRSAAAGQPRLVLVRGGAGVGKTRLVAELEEVAAREGAAVARSQCFGTAGRLALAPVADWLRNPNVQSAIAMLEPVWQAEVDRLVPSGTAHEASFAGARAMIDAWQRHRFFEGLARALTRVGRPTLLVLDNMQWCDEETLAFLTFCLATAPDAPLLVAATLRDDDLDENGEVLDWIARMRSVGSLIELGLNPLDGPNTARLAEAIAGRPLDGRDAELLHSTTGGFPLYVVEAVRTAVDIGSTPIPARDLMSVLRNRLDQASPTAREIGGLAAAVGRNFSLDLLTEASDLEVDAVVQAVDELWRRRIIYELGDGYDFSHDLLREASYSQITPPKRWLLHRRIAQGLELLHADDLDAVSAQLAEQYAHGGRPDRAVIYYRRAADLASGMFAHAEAIRLNHEALALVRAQPAGRDRDSRELAVLEAMAAPLTARYGYSSPELQQTVERSIALADRLGRKDAMLASLFGLWTSRFVQGRVADGHEVVTRALTLVDSDSELSGSAHFAFAGSSLSLGRPAEALRHFELARRLTHNAHLWTIGTRPDVHGMAWSAHAHWLLGHDEEALTTSREAIALARSVDHPYSLAVALAYASITNHLRQDLAALRDTVEELQQLCARYGFAYYREWGVILDGWLRADETGVELARRGIGNLRSEGSYARMPYWLALLADVSARNNQFEAAQAILDAALVAGRTHDDLWWLPEVLRMRAEYDDEQAAIARLHSAVQLAADHGSLALLRRCERDLVDRGVPVTASGAS